VSPNPKEGADQRCAGRAEPASTPGDRWIVRPQAPITVPLLFPIVVRDKGLSSFYESLAFSVNLPFPNRPTQAILELPAVESFFILGEEKGE
jgi:hypothetical protein